MMLHGLVELHISLSEHVSNLWWGLSPLELMSALKLPWQPHMHLGQSTVVGG